MLPEDANPVEHNEYIRQSLHDVQTMYEWSRWLRRILADWALAVEQEKSGRGNQERRVTQRELNTTGISTSVQARWALEPLPCATDQVTGEIMLGPGEPPAQHHTPRLHTKPPVDLSHRLSQGRMGKLTVKGVGSFRGLIIEREAEDSRWVVTVSRNGRACLWDVSQATRVTGSSAGRKVTVWRGARRADWSTLATGEPPDQEGIHGALANRPTPTNHGTVTGGEHW